MHPCQAESPQCPQLLRQRSSLKNYIASSEISSNTSLIQIHKIKIQQLNMKNKFYLNHQYNTQTIIHKHTYSIVKIDNTSNITKKQNKRQFQPQFVDKKFSRTPHKNSFRKRIASQSQEHYTNNRNTKCKNQFLFQKQNKQTTNRIVRYISVQKLQFNKHNIHKKNIKRKVCCQSINGIVKLIEKTKGRGRKQYLNRNIQESQKKEQYECHQYELTMSPTMI